MKVTMHSSCAPCGDVTGREPYQTTAGEILSAILQQGQSQAVKEAEKNARVLKVTNYPVSYISARALYERRTAVDRTTPSPRVETAASRLRRAEEYDPWQVDCHKPPVGYVKKSFDIAVPGSDFLCGCETCQTQGYTDCACGNGQETCGGCGGSGAVVCGGCGGSGAMICGSCGGSGYLEYGEWRSSSQEDHSPEYVTWREPCGCNGGEVPCRSCGGSGELDCRSCGGSGIVTCSRCGGTLKVTCEGCEGQGYLLHSVRILQDFNAASTQQTLRDYLVDARRYGKQRFSQLSPNENDVLLSTQEDTAPLREIPLQQIMPGQYDAPMNAARLMEKLARLSIDRKKDPIESLSVDEAVARLCREDTTPVTDARFVRYQAEVRQRDVLEIQYQFQDGVYHLLADTATGACLMDRSPYQNVVAGLLKELEQHYHKGELRSFGSKYQEIADLSGAKNVTIDTKTIDSMVRRIRACCTLVSGGTSLAAVLLMHLIFPIGSTLLAVLYTLLGVGVPVVLTDHLPDCFLSDRKNRTYQVAAGLSAVVAVLLRLLLGLLF